jgi:hypothetical protein
MGGRLSLAHVIDIVFSLFTSQFHLGSALNASARGTARIAKTFNAATEVVGVIFCIKHGSMNLPALRLTPCVIIKNLTNPLYYGIMRNSFFISFLFAFPRRLVFLLIRECFS